MDTRAIRPRAVAREVLENLRQGKKPDIGKIALKHGYAETTANSGMIQTTKAYKEYLAEENAATAELMSIERSRAIAEMPAKIKKARYRDLIDATDKLTKNHQLLTGGATENINTRGSIVMLPGTESKDKGATEP